MANEKAPSTPDGTVLWNGLFTPQLPKDPKPTDQAKYSVRLGFTAEQMSTAEFKNLKAIVVAAAKASPWGAKAEAMMKEGSVRLPFRTDIAAKGYPEHFKCFINLTSKNPPGIVDRYMDPATGKARAITDPKEIFSGCMGRATVRAHAYGGGTTGFTPGVSLYLQNFQLRNEAGKTYERLDGRTSGEDDFGAEPAAEVNDFGAEDMSSSIKGDLNDLLS